MPGDDFTASTIANANATIAQNNATAAWDAADRAGCMVMMHGYQNDKATVEQARTYASCVRTVYGFGTQYKLELKLLVVACIASTLLGAWVFYRKDKEASMAMLGGMVGLTLAMFVFGLGGEAILFLFS